MTKALLNNIKIEFEQTELSIEDILQKYSCTTKDLKGYTTWTKHPENSIESNIKLVYETLYSPNIEDYLEQDIETIEADIVSVANDIKTSKQVDINTLPKQARDGFEGLRLLDTKMQTQALTLLTTIDQMINNVETAKDVRDLVASHTAIRDSYFNTKAPMVNIMNGDVVQGNKNELATLLEGTPDDC